MAVKRNPHSQNWVVMNALIIALGHYFDVTMRKKPLMYEMKDGSILFMAPAFLKKVNCCFPNASYPDKEPLVLFNKSVAHRGCSR